MMDIVYIMNVPERCTMTTYTLTEAHNRHREVFDRIGAPDLSC